MLTAKEAYELGLPGTYMGDDGDGGPSNYFPASFCIRCMADPSQMGKHDGCVWKYWGTEPWVPTDEELESYQNDMAAIMRGEDVPWVPE